MNPRVHLCCKPRIQIHGEFHHDTARKLYFFRVKPGMEDVELCIPTLRVSAHANAYALRVATMLIVLPAVSA